MKLAFSRAILSAAVGALLLTSTLSLSAKPVRNVSAARHPNIAAAQRLATQSYDKIVAAQKANEFDLGGHAQKAKELLEQVNEELKLAAQAANENRK